MHCLKITDYLPIIYLNFFPMPLYTLCKNDTRAFFFKNIMYDSNLVKYVKKGVQASCVNTLQSFSKNIAYVNRSGKFLSYNKVQNNQ